MGRWQTVPYESYGLQDCISNGTDRHDLNATLFTTQVVTDIVLNQNRPELIVSSTSCDRSNEFYYNDRSNEFYELGMSGISSVLLMDKAFLLAQVINHLKEMRRSAAEATESILIPMDIDEVRVEQQEDGSDGDSYSIEQQFYACLETPMKLPLGQHTYYESEDS